MAQIHPDFYTIQHLHQPATEGELILLDFLQKNLNMEFEIYYHPFINGDRPNIVILKKGCGAIIISVNDWDLTDYAINDDLDWWNNSTSTKVQSPFSQINYYKENLVSLHISTFLEKKMNKWYYSNIIYTLVYFHKMSQDNIEKFIHENISKEDNKTKFLKDIKYIQYWGYDSLTLQNLEEYFSKIRIEQPSFLFDEDIYNNFKRYLKPPFHQLEEGIDIKYTKAQAELIRSESRPRRKIKGIAGSGKTLVLAKRAVNAGFDVVEIHAGHSYLISQFLSPTTNDRTDEFGGSAKNRARFCRMVIDEVRKAVGPRVPISLRLSVDELVEGGNTVEDCLEYLEYLNDEVDIYDTSAGLNASIQYQIDANYLEDGWRSYMAKAVRDKFGKPTIAIGNIRDPKIADDILARGDADLIGIGRGLIADPDWCNKAQYGDVCDIRKCISCNVGCVGNRIGGNKPLRCTINPDLINGEAYKKQKVNKPCNVVVVGAGTAGLEAACTAAEVGCNVTLLEKGKEVGGLSVEISKIPAKKRLADFPTYLKHRASKLSNLTIKTGVDATVAEIKKYKPDLVVNSTGSVPLLPPIEGLHDNLGKKDASVYSIKDMIANLKNYPEDMTGKKVVVVGGGAVGLDVVEFFAPRGAETTIIEMMPIIGNGLDASSTSSMKECMEKHHVRQMTNTALQKVNAHSFLVKYDGKEEELPFDYGFVCLGMRANAPIWNDIQEAFVGEDVEVLNIGDSVRARRIIDGTDAGRHMVLNTLERLNYL